MPTKKDDGYERLADKLDLIKEHIDDKLKTIDTRLEKIDARLEKGDDRLDSIDKTGSANAAVLAEHVKRSNLLEEKMESDRKSVSTELAPIKTHVTQVKFVMKILGALAAAGGLGGAGIGIKELLKALFGG
jgi:Skp family chaperone for outer membrane proteins